MHPDPAKRFHPGADTAQAGGGENPGKARGEAGALPPDPAADSSPKLGTARHSGRECDNFLHLHSDKFTGCLGLSPRNSGL